MKLLRFNSTALQNHTPARLIFVEKSISYLDEFFEEYPALGGVPFSIVDDYSRNWGRFSYHGMEVIVEPMEHLSEELNADAKTQALIIITSDYFIEAYEKLASMPTLEDYVDCIYYYPNKETQIEEQYRKKYADTPLLPIIVFRSGPHASQYVYGTDFSDNARALFEYMLFHGYTNKYQLVWLVKDPEAMRAYFHRCYDDRMLKELGEIISDEKVLFLSYEWSIDASKEQQDAYYGVLCLAQIFFFTDAYGFVRGAREDQVRVQLWHGCGFKTRTNFVPCEKRYEYNIVIGEKYRQIHKQIYGLRDDQVLITGYPKEDWLFCYSYKEKYKRLGITSENKVIFWLPTFRKAKSSMANLDEYESSSETGLPILHDIVQLQKLDLILQEKDTFLVVKLHPFSSLDGRHFSELKNILFIDNTQLFDEGIQINELLAGADALISDYSSVAVDYLLLNRPIAFLLEDVEEYENSRGFVFENIRDWLPGEEVYDADGFYRFVTEVAEGIDSTKLKREEIRAKMHDFADADSCIRVCEAFDL